MCKPNTTPFVLAGARNGDTGERFGDGKRHFVSFLVGVIRQGKALTVDNTVTGGG